jgi:hypothetical protein
MADIIDKANDLAEFHLRNALRNQRIGAKTAPISAEGIGMCLFCSQPVEGERRFCDRECADGFEAEQRRG